MIINNSVTRMKSQNQLLIGRVDLIATYLRDLHKNLCQVFDPATLRPILPVVIITKMVMLLIDLETHFLVPVLAPTSTSFLSSSALHAEV